MLPYSTEHVVGDYLMKVKAGSTNTTKLHLTVSRIELALHCDTVSCQIQLVGTDKTVLIALHQHPLLRI